MMGDLSDHFSRREFKCKGNDCDFDTVDAELLAILEVVRVNFDAPVIINSACRCIPHNARVGGAPNSQHVYGRAADIVVKGVDADEVAAFLEATFPNKLGIGRYNGRTHVDTRNGKARWDNRR